MADDLTSEGKKEGKSKSNENKIPAKGAKSGGATGAPPEKVKYRGSQYPDKELPEEFVEGVKLLEEALKMPVWMLIQSNIEPIDSLNDLIWRMFYKEKESLGSVEQVALVLHSPGGQAKTAFQVASLFQRQCKFGFKAVVPQYAKSAATLLSLGANEIILNDYAELGPLDAQLFDREREGGISALDEVQALERLQASSLEAVDQAMYLLLSRTGKKVETLLPHILNYATNMMHPLLEKIDTVHYTQMSRILKVAEEYATRLLRYRYSPEESHKIARRLVEKYPEHGFVIDHKEAKEIGLKVRTPQGNESSALAKIEKYVSKLTVIGTLKELENEPKD